MGELFNLRRGMATLGVAPMIARPSTDTTSFDPLALLLAEVAMGNERAFARLYELTGGRLLAIARGIVGRQDVAEDVLQDSLLRVWRWAYRFEPGKGAAYGWLVRIVRNRALTARATLQRREHVQEALDAETMVLGEPDPADRAMRSEDARRVNSCLANLPANHRRSITLVYFEGLTHSELAERLGVQLGTAKSWVRRGLAQMNRCLTGNELGGRELVAAEYAAGGLPEIVRRGFERRRERDARYCRAVDLWEDRLALLTEFMPDTGPAPAQVWNRIEQGLARERIAMRRPLLWQITSGVLVLAVVALLIRLAGG
ncbi:MAG: RNA polymerase sigma factor [Reyranella sp.]|uniref:RNA polymerase sigma factor n=1 Tax=Reyranella sp. TaxID=1929291 RepID=UPI001AC7A3F4|nr:RNA polymerase sigma factor [Reyranella sp.]MBN9089879.1 RNA polymerase sigma factor [Reyranella sp.]